MRHCRKILLLALALAAPAPNQADDLPPWIILLARVKAHLRQELARLTDCVRLETIRREYRPAGGRMRPLDTIRLEVLSTGHREMFASPGDRKFTEGHPAQFSASGVIGDGLFALLLSDVAAEHGPSFEYRGIEDLDGRRLARFDYRVPLMISGHSMAVNGIQATVGTKGSFWADEKTFDVLRLEVHAEDIPPSLPIEDAVTTVDYARMRLGDREMLLPVGGDYWQSKFSGEESHNRIEFTHCRLFAAESSISFGPEDPAARGRKAEVVARDAEVARELPGALLVTTRLTSALTDKWRSAKCWKAWWRAR